MVLLQDKIKNEEKESQRVITISKFYQVSLNGHKKAMKNTNLINFLSKYPPSFSIFSIRSIGKIIAFNHRKFYFDQGLTIIFECSP